jgi:hypothetical protein
MEKISPTIKYNLRLTNSGSMRKRCNLHRLKYFFVCYFILIVFYGESTTKECNNRSNYGCIFSTSQTVSKQEQATNNNPVKKHQKAQLQSHDPKCTNSNQATINNRQQTKKKATTNPPGRAQFQSQLQNPKCANCNNTNKQTRTTTTNK